MSPPRLYAPVGRKQPKALLWQDEDCDDPDLALAHQTINRLKRERAILVEHLAKLKEQLDAKIDGRTWLDVPAWLEAGAS